MFQRSDVLTLRMQGRFSFTLGGTTQNHAERRATGLAQVAPLVTRPHVPPRSRRRRPFVNERFQPERSGDGARSAPRGGSDRVTPGYTGPLFEDRSGPGPTEVWKFKDRSLGP